MKFQHIFVRICLRIAAIAILSFVLLLVSVPWVSQNGYYTLGDAVTRILLFDQPHSFLGGLGDAIAIEFVVDFTVCFGLLFGIWFLWRQGRNGREKQRNSTLLGTRLRFSSVLVVAILSALPLSFYGLQVKSKFHHGLAETPGEVMASFVLITGIAAIALCGIAILGRFWPSIES